MPGSEEEKLPGGKGVKDSSASSSSVAPSSPWGSPVTPIYNAMSSFASSFWRRPEVNSPVEYVESNKYVEIKKDEKEKDSPLLRKLAVLEAEVAGFSQSRTQVQESGTQVQQFLNQAMQTVEGNLEANAQTRQALGIAIEASNRVGASMERLEEGIKEEKALVDQQEQTLKAVRRGWFW